MADEPRVLPTAAEMRRRLRRAAPLASGAGIGYGVAAILLPLVHRRAARLDPILEPSTQHPDLGPAARERRRLRGGLPRGQWRGRDLIVYVFGGLLILSPIVGPSFSLAFPIWVVVLSVMLLHHLANVPDDELPGFAACYLDEPETGGSSVTGD